MRCIYKIQFPNNKIYIGQTCDFEGRMRKYKNLHCKSQIKLYYAIEKYKWKNCKYEIIDTCQNFDVDAKEAFYINKFKSNNDNYGYNLDSGGHKNKNHSNETKNKISKSMKGKKFTKEHKNKLSESAKKRKRDYSGQNGGMFGKHHSEETKLKMKNSLIGKKHGPMAEEHKKKISESHVGKKHSEETIYKIQKSNKNFWKNKK